METVRGIVPLGPAHLAVPLVGTPARLAGTCAGPAVIAGPTLRPAGASL